ncbi:MAG: hypothetical protein ACRC6X_03135 [Culicoidibacterales bacterium]
MAKIKNKKQKGLLILLLLVIFFVIISYVIQTYFMPVWYDGNTSVSQESSKGVHEQVNSVGVPDEKTVAIY